MQRVGDVTRIRIDGPLEVGSDGVVRARCHWCRQPVEVPVALRAGSDDVPVERFVIGRPSGIDGDGGIG